MPPGGLGKVQGLHIATQIAGKAVTEASEINYNTRIKTAMVPRKKKIRKVKKVCCVSDGGCEENMAVGHL